MGHPGLNNDYLVKTEHPHAVTYHDKSPLENFHSAEGWRLLSAPTLPHGGRSGSLSAIKPGDGDGDGAGAGLTQLPEAQGLLGGLVKPDQIGRASCRERVYVLV